MSRDERVLVEVTVAAPVDVVWDALRDPVQVRRWFGWDDPGLAEEIRLIFHELATVEERRRVSWADGDAIELTPQGEDRSRVRIVRTARTPGWDGVHDEVDEGWITFAQQLRFALERHRGEDRRTVADHAVDLGPEGEPLLDRLGLRPLGAQPVGSRYAVRLPDGSAVSGEVVFQTDLQLGLSVEQEGDALLVVARTPPTSAPPNGTARFLLSLYGRYAADDDHLSRTTARWRAWWAPGVGAPGADAPSPGAGGPGPGAEAAP